MSAHARVLFGLLLLLVGGSGCAGGPAVEERRGGPGMEAFDYDWSIEMLDGGPVEFEALRGRVLLVNLWASWCPPCVAELDSFERLRAHLDSADVEVTLLFVSPERREVVELFVERRGWALPFAVERRRAPATLGPLVLPTTFVVDRAGRIALRHRGASDWDRPEVVDLLAALAEEDR